MWLVKSLVYIVVKTFLSDVERSQGLALYFHLLSFFLFFLFLSASLFLFLFSMYLYFCFTFLVFVFLLDGRGRGGKVVKRWKGRAWSFYLCWHLPVIHCPHCILYFFLYFVFCIFFLSLLAPPGYTLPIL